jgi:beta-galactosidase
VLVLLQIGESAIGSAATAPDLQAEGGGQPWQWHISFCGDIDIVGKQKPQSYYRTVLWDNSPIEMAVHRPPGTQGERVSGWGWPDEVQSWTWDGHEGKPLEVRVFAKCKSGKVALKLNGKDVSGSPALINRATQFTASFTVPFAAGKLSASCPGDANATRTFTSAKAAAKLVVTADRPSINAYRGDLSYVTALVVDADGTPLPEARVKVTFAVSGDGELAAVGSGDPTDVASFSVPQRTTWMGQAVAILRPTTTSAGSIKLTASAPGLTSGEVTVTTTALSPSAL